MMTDLRNRMFSGIMVGCTDHNCIVTGSKTTMGTNGGCKCLVNASRSQLVMLQCRLGLLLNEAEVWDDPIFIRKGGD